MPKKEKTTGKLVTMDSLPIELFQTEAETDKEIKVRTPSDSDTAKLNYVDRRKMSMINDRKVVDKNWDVYMDMYEAIFEAYPDERSSSVVPLGRALVEMYVAEALKIKTEFNFKCENSEKYGGKARVYEYVWKNDWRRNKRARQFMKQEYTAGAFGTAVMYTGYNRYSTTQYDLEMDGDTAKYRENTIEIREIMAKDIDIRNRYCDNECQEEFDSANDCYYRERTSYEKFLTIKNSIFYKNTEYVKPRGYSAEYMPYSTDQEATKQGRFVLLEHYWNLQKDAYITIANGVIIRETPIPSTIDGVKALPFVLRVLGKKFHRIWGVGLLEASMMFNSEINDLREMLMDAVRRSNTQVLAIGGGLTFNGREFAYDNEIITFDGDIDKNFKQLSGNPPNQAIFNHMNEIYKSIAVYVGIDIQNIMGTPQQTAFQTEVQRESSQKRINTWLVNRDMAYERYADLMLDLLKMRFPQKDADGMRPQLEIDGEEITSDAKGENVRVKKTKGKSNMLEVTPEMMRADGIYIDVYTNTSLPTINAVEREQKMNLMKEMSNMINGYATAKMAGYDLEQVLPFKPTMKSMAESFNLETDAGHTYDDVQEAKNKLVEDMEKMASGAMPQPTSLPGPEQPLQDNPAPQGQPQPQM